MKIKNVIFAAQFLAIAFTAEAKEGIVIKNGGDAVMVEDGKFLTFDEVEYLEPFRPDSQGEAWDLIDARLKSLSAKLPKTESYLRRVMTGGVTLWWFVAADLREIDDHGDSVVLVDTQMKQLAANKEGVIQINKVLWDGMSPRSRASILLHEAMWTAVGPQNVANGSAIRFLAQFFLNPTLDKMTATQISEFVSKYARETSPRARALKLDIIAGQTTQPWTVTEVSTPASVDLVVTMQGVANGEGHTSSLMITKLNSDPRARFVYHAKARPFIYLAEAAGSVVNTPNFNLNQLCNGLKYATKTDWRLPTVSEVYSLYNLGLLEVRHLPMNHELKFLRNPNPTLFTSTFVYPNLAQIAGGGPLLLATAEGRILDLSNHAADVTGNPARETEFIHYVCVHP
jgi:hypothetical protein